MNRTESRYFSTAVKMDQALLALLAEKPFDYITVSEICKRAGVNRSTFYLHYDNTCELLAETSRYLIDGFLAYFPVDTAQIARQFADCGAEELLFVSREYLVPYLSYIRDNARVFSTALAHVSSFDFDGVFQRLLRHVFDPILERFHYPPGDRRYVMRFYLSGVNAIVGEWLAGGCRESIDEMARIIEECILGREAPAGMELGRPGERKDGRMD